MLALEIVLIVAGLFFFTLSFFVTEKLSDSDIEYIKKLSEKEINVLLKQELDAASEKIQASIDEKTEDAIARIEAETDKDTDNKLLSIGEYGDTVIKNFNENSEKTLESVNKSHDQITFIYSMLSDKEQKIDKLSKKLAYEEDYLRAFRSSIEEKAEELKKMNIEVTAEDIKNASAFSNSRKDDEASESVSSENSKMDTSEEEVQDASGDSVKTENLGISDLNDLKAAFEKEISNEKSENEKRPGEKSINEKVLALYKQGYSEVEIAKNLGKGVGEVKLILGLFDEGNKS